jgi:periplasmic protein TonB
MAQKELIYTDWNSVVSDTRNDAVFANRNKSYGAYLIRKNYNRLAVLAFYFAAGAFTLSITSPLIYHWIKGHGADKEVEKKEVIADLMAPPPVNPDEPPPPPPPPPPPVVQQIAFKPPVIVDKPIQEEAPPPVQEDLTDKNIGTQNIDSGLTEAPPPDPVVEKPSTGEIFQYVQEMPKFPGGDQKLLEYIQKHINYPAIARENGISGRITVRFVVDENGKVSMANVPKGMGIGGGCDEEAVRVINTLPEWTPGKQNGHAVKVWYTVPVIFRLQ